MPANNRTLALAVLIAICAGLFFAARGLANWLHSSRFGKREITLATGSKLFVIREEWGWHSSGSEISLTRNPDGCIPPNPDTDYIDTYGDGQSLVYSSTADGLILFEDLGQVSMHEPRYGWAGPKVSVQKTSALGNMLRDPKAYGVTVVKVPLNEVCWKHFFRNAGTSLRNGR